MAENIQQNDSAGGFGSLLSGLANIAVSGISRAVDGSLSKKYPLTSQNETVTVDAFGNILPRSAPQAGTSATTSLSGILTSPVGVAIGVALLAGGLVLLAVKVAR